MNKSFDGVRWQVFPKNKRVKQVHMDIVSVFVEHYFQICSPLNELKSDDVLAIVRKGLESLDFSVEKGKKKSDKINVPVLYGENGFPEKYFEADAFSQKHGIVIEVEAGRAYLNNQFLKDIFQACVMDGVDSLVLAVRNEYKKSYDFDKIKSFLETLYVSGKFNLELESIVLIGY